MKSCIAILILALCGSVLAADADKAPEPTSQQAAEALKLVKDVFKDDYAKRGPEERKALAQKLLDEGKSTTSDPASQYAIFCESRDLAVQVCDVETAMSAIEEIDKAFQVNLVQMKLDALTALRGTCRVPEQHSAAADATTALLDDAQKANNFEVASKAIDLLLAFATGAKDMPQVAYAQSKKNEIKNQSTSYLDMKISEDKLKSDPKDSGANYAVGFYTAVYDNDWDKGLAMLVQGSNGAWASAAKADLANPVDVGEMVKLADQWYDLAIANPSAKIHVMVRAEFWYNLCAPNADGIIRAKIDRRLDEIAALKPDSMGGVSEATRKELPTAAEMAKLKELAKTAGTNMNDMDKLMQLRQTLEARLVGENNEAVNGTDADYFARAKADNQIRKITAGPNDRGNFYQPFVDSLSNFTANSKSKDQFAARLRSYERIEQLDRVLDVNTIENCEYNAIRNYVIRNLATFGTSELRLALCDFLKSHGAKGAAVDRYRAFLARNINAF